MPEIFSPFTPMFVPVFEKIRNDNSKHLTMKRPDGSYKVVQSEIDELAKGLIANEFYTYPWLTGCRPETVLFPKVIEGLKSDDPDIRRVNVNLAYQAEDRVIKMGVDSFVDWCRAGRDPSQLSKTSDESVVAAEYRLPPRRNSTSLTKLTKETRDAIEKIYNNKDLLSEMPASLRGRIKNAHEDIEAKQLFEEFAEMTLEIFEQWRVGRKTLIDLSRLVPEAIDQREEMLANYSASAIAVAHCAKLVGSITDPKKLQKLLKEGVVIQQKLSLPN